MKQHVGKQKCALKIDILCSYVPTDPPVVTIVPLLYPVENCVG